MKLLSTPKARKELAKYAPWIKGGILNHVTFERLVKEGLLPYAGRIENGPRVFLEDDVTALAKKMPKKRPPNRVGIINWLKGERPKKKTK